MKTKLLWFTGYGLLAIGICLGLVSASRYDLLLSGSLLVGLGAIACLASCLRSASTLERVVLLFGIVIAAITMVDALL